MKTNEDVIKSNQQVLEALNAFKKENGLKEIKVQKDSRWKRVKVKLVEVFEQTLFNVIDDLPTTLTGFFCAALIVYNDYPEITTETWLQAFGFGSLGAIGTSRSLRFYQKKMNQRVTDDEQLEK